MSTRYAVRAEPSPQTAQVSQKKQTHHLPPAPAEKSDSVLLTRKEEYMCSMATD